MIQAVQGFGILDDEIRAIGDEIERRTRAGAAAGIVEGISRAASGTTFLVIGTALGGAVAAVLVLLWLQYAETRRCCPSGRR